MSDVDTTTKTARPDGTRAAVMTDAEIHAAAMADPDARPMTDEEFAAAIKTPRVRIIRRALRLTAEDFATRYRIPLRVIQDWEQHIAEPDPVARAYLRAIAGDPDGVAKALLNGPGAG